MKIKRILPDVAVILLYYITFRKDIVEHFENRSYLVLFITILIPIVVILLINKVISIFKRKQKDEE